MKCLSWAWLRRTLRSSGFLSFLPREEVRNDTQREVARASEGDGDILEFPFYKFRNSVCRAHVVEGGRN